MKSRVWTKEEIDILRAGFNKGKIVKILANEVGRSATAVNKFLSRSGIRTRRWKITNHKSKSLKRNGSLVLNRSKTLQNNAKFTDILSYLRQKGYSIVRSDFNPNHFADSKYLVNNKPYSELKMLLLANKIRVEEHKSIFKIPELMWE